MSREYDIKDVLTEAAKRDYEDVQNVRWIPSDGHKNFINGLYAKTEKGRFFSSGLFKGLTVAAVIVLLFGVSMALKPIREPMAAFFGSIFGKPEQTGTEIADVSATDAITTDFVTQRSAVTEKPAKETTAITETDESETDEAETEYTQKTDEDWIDVLVEAIASGDNSDKRWDLLHEYGEVAFDHLVKRYFNGEKDTKVKAVISVFVSETLKDEVSACESFPRLYFPDRTELKTDAHSTWLSSFKSKAQIYVKKTVKEDALKELPTVCRFVSLVGYESYRFDPNRNSVGECIDRLIEVYTTEVFDNLSKERKNETIEYCAKNYFTETDRTRRVFMSWLVFCAVGRWEMTDLVGYDLVITFYRYGDSSYISGGSNGFMYHPDIVEPIIEKYADAAKKKAETLYREETEHDFPGTYVLLSALGFDGYKPEPFDIAYRSRPLLEELNVLYQAVTYGVGSFDDTSEYFYSNEYQHEGIKSNTYPDGLKEKIEKYWSRKGYGTDYPMMITQKQGLKTIDEWYDHFSTFLPEELVRGFIRESKNFIINNGTVYTPEDGYIGMWFTEIHTRTAHIVEEKDGYTVIAFDVQKGGHMAYEITEFTINVVEDNGALRIIGGTFIDRYMKDDIKTAAADVLHSILLMHSVWYNGNIEQPPYSVTEYNSIEDIPYDVRDYYKSDVFPSYSCWTLVDELHWDDYLDEDNVTAVFENAKAIYTFTADLGRYIYIIPSLVRYTDVPLLCEKNELSVYNILNNLKVISKDGDSMTCSLDFIRQENGEKKNVTYTFEFEYTNESRYIQLTGGTFLTEVLLGK